MHRELTTIFISFYFVFIHNPKPRRLIETKFYTPQFVHSSSSLLTTLHSGLDSNTNPAESKQMGTAILVSQVGKGLQLFDTKNYKPMQFIVSLRFHAIMSHFDSDGSYYSSE